MASPYTSRRTYWGLVAVSTLLAWPMARQTIYPQYKRKSDAHEKTVILTGATGTLGTATAYHLAKRNCRLIMACRNMDKCRILRRELVLLTRNNSICCRRLDLEDVNSINDFADDMIQNEPHIDTLINSAGVKYLPERELTRYGIEKHFWINFLAPYLLTFRLLDKLKESAKNSKDSRVVNIVGHPKNSWELDLDDLNFDKRQYSAKKAYEQSKLALSLFTITFNKFFENPDNVRAFGVSPPRGRISPILNHRDGNSLGSVLAVFRTWYSQCAQDACGTSVLCAVDDYILKHDGGGGRYSYMLQAFGRNKGWRSLAERHLDAQVVWNLAANILLHIPDRGKATTNGLGQYINVKQNNTSLAKNSDKMANK